MQILETLKRHMNYYLEHAVWPDDSAAPGLWWSMLDLNTGRQPSPERPAGVAKRCYRWIESPEGSNLYWDGPLVVAAHALSNLTNEPHYAQAADRYIHAYLTRASSANGLFWWGNHYYLDHQAQPVWFAGQNKPMPVNDAHAHAPLHETRPLPVPWALLYKVAPTQVIAALSAHDRHLAPAGGPGCFNRHADGKVEYAFLESGGILALTLAYAHHLAGLSDASHSAHSVLHYSLSKRDPQTNLIPINPTRERWDFHTTTSEVGLWANAALATADLLNMPEMEQAAVHAIQTWTQHAWNDSTHQFHGRIRIKTGQPDCGPKPSIYSPGTWCDPWEPLFPAHDYPFQMAEACISAWQRTGESCHALAVERWADSLHRSLPARNGLGAYAEHYGRAIHFFWRAAKTFSRPDWTSIAHNIAHESLQVLHHPSTGALRSHPGENRIDSVDGIGWLILALLSMESNTEQETYGLLW